MAGVAAALALLTVNPLLTVLVVVAQAMISLLLWRAKEPPVLWLIAQLQWLQGSMAVLHADALGEQLWTRSASHSPEQAVVLTLAWTVTWALGIRLGMGAERVPATASLPIIPMRTLLLIYAVHSVIDAGQHVLPIGGARQLFVAFSTLRWAILYAIFAVGLRTAAGRQIVWAMFAFEIVIGWLGFFSTFRLVLLVMFLAAATRLERLTLRRLVGLAALVSLGFGLAVLWSTVKLDYREALSQGTSTQGAQIGVGERAETLQRLTGKVDEGAIASGQRALLERIAYTEYFALVLDFVPRVRPHSEGLLWSNAAEHVFMPRLFFPDKAALGSDSEFTERYTGLHFSSTRGGGTSISVGLVAENYIEFGALAMFLPGLLLGLIYGAIHRGLLRRFGLVSASMVVATFLTSASIENGIVKTIGSLLMETGVVVIVLMALGPRLRGLEVR